VLSIQREQQIVVAALLHRRTKGRTALNGARENWVENNLQGKVFAK
jgi:hypothetical protein